MCNVRGGPSPGGKILSQFASGLAGGKSNSASQGPKPVSMRPSYEDVEQEALTRGSGRRGAQRRSFFTRD